MPARVHSRESYDALLAAYRDEPGNHTNAARLAGINRGTARKVWEHGWPRFSWSRPIKDVIADERRAALSASAQARKLVVEETAAKRSRALQEAFEAEGKIVAGQRGNLGMAVVRLRGLLRVAGVVESTMIDSEGKVRPEAEQVIREMPLAARLRLLADLAKATPVLTSAITAAIDWNRKTLGDPSVVLPAPEAADGRSPEQRLDDLRQLRESIDRAEGFLTAAAPPPPGEAN